VNEHGLASETRIKTSAVSSIFLNLFHALINASGYQHQNYSHGFRRRRGATEYGPTC
jgi:hypothetical protein